VLSRLPAYDATWRPTVRVTAEYRLPQKQSVLRVASDEYLRGVELHADSVRRSYNGRVHKDSVAVAFSADWIRLEGSELVRAGSADTVEIDWRLRSEPAPYNITLRLSADSGRVDSVASPLAFRKGKREVIFSWGAWPQPTLAVRATVVVSKTSRLVRQVTATYTEMPLPVVVHAPSAHVLWRAKVTSVDTLRIERM
jgi:hypothetical protein